MSIAYSTTSHGHLTFNVSYKKLKCLYLARKSYLIALELSLVLKIFILIVRTVFLEYTPISVKIITMRECEVSIPNLRKSYAMLELSHYSVIMIC